MWFLKRSVEVCAFKIFNELPCFSSFDEVKGYLQQHLMAIEKSKILEETDKTELYCLYMNCLEVCKNSNFTRVLQRVAR